MFVNARDTAGDMFSKVWKLLCDLAIILQQRPQVGMSAIEFQQKWLSVRVLFAERIIRNQTHYINDYKMGQSCLDLPHRWV